MRETQSKDGQSSHKNYKWQIKEFLKVQPTHSQRNANCNSNVIVFVIYYICKDSGKRNIGDS